MKALLPVLTFITRHILFVALAMVTGCVLWSLFYLALLLLGILLNQGLGGPLTFPVGIIAIVAGCGVIGWGIFAPASAVGAIFCRLFRLPKIAAIPFVWVSAFVFSYFVYWGWIELATTHSLPPVAVVLKNYTIFLSIPLGIYWWLTEGPGALFDGFRRWLQRIRSRRNAGNETEPAPSRLRGMIE